MRPNKNCHTFNFGHITPEAPTLVANPRIQGMCGITPDGIQIPHDAAFTERKKSIFTDSCTFSFDCILQTMVGVVNLKFLPYLRQKAPA